MKYLEFFGDLKSLNGIKSKNLKIGDYVSISNEFRGSYKGKIIDKKESIKVSVESSLLYIQEEDGQIRVSGLRTSKIRHLTPEEIEDFEMRLNSNKYNL